MICYLIRHGMDDDSVRGGWSDSPLLPEGIRQIETLAESLRADQKLNISFIYTSDLLRARQTADILSHTLNLPVVSLPEFREVNNGILAGMKNDQASKLYPGLYWNRLGWDEAYPGGESPAVFYERISVAWQKLKTQIRRFDSNVVLVTHGGVINAIRCIENGIKWSNKIKYPSVNHGDVIPISIK